MSKGLGREDAHRIIKQAAVKAVHEMRNGRPNLFLSYLSDNEGFPAAEISKIATVVDHGLAPEQIHQVCARIDVVLARYPDKVNYQPYPLR
jgi:adenylosuccinate lyase